MTGISCDEELITKRYDYLKKSMTPDSHLSIFSIANWKDPWGFGRDNVVKANDLYAEALLSLGYVSSLNECDTLSVDESSGMVFITLKSKDQFGIVYIVDSFSDLPEYVEDLFNHVAAQIPNKVPVQLKQVQESKKPDNLVISRMKIFSHGLPNL